MLQANDEPTQALASGVDLGSDMLFGTRLGFSGTPSNLLPMELRPCHFEPGSEAQVVRITTNPGVMSVREVTDWTLSTIINLLRNKDNDPANRFNAMIDTGALSAQRPACTRAGALMIPRRWQLPVTPMRKSAARCCAAAARRTSTWRSSSIRATRKWCSCRERPRG